MRGVRHALRRGLCVAAFALVVSGWAQDVKVEKYRLPNGMTVILHEDHSLPIATINIWYRVGSKDEPPRRSGFAHLFEHLMFMGTKRVPNGQFDQIMEKAGGSNNASTAVDRTNYYSVGPSNLLPTLLWLDADRLEDLGVAMDVKKLDLQRDVVKNERRENVENTPYGKAYEAINAIMFPENHPYGHSVIGSMADLSAGTLQDVQDFFATFYVPNNASLVVAGDFDPKTLKPMIAQWFGTLPRRNDPPRPLTPTVDFKGIVRQTMVDQVQVPKSIMVWHSPAAYSAGDAEMQIAAAVLSSGLSSRLYERLVVKDKLATDVSAFQEQRRLGSLFYVDATAAPGADQDRLEAAIDQELATFAKSGPRADELKRVVAQIEYGAVASLQSLRDKADKLNEYEYYFGEPNSFARVLDLYRKATPRGIRDAARRTLNPENRLIMRVLPETEVAEGQKPRETAPAIGNEATFTPPTPSNFTLSNGLKVQFFRRPELPLMAVSALIRGGGENDPTDKLGRGSLTAAMLDEGAGSRNAKAFQDALDEIGASFSAGADEQSTSATLSVLSTKFDQGLALYADALLRPRFDTEEFARVQRLRIAGLEQENDDPGAVAIKVSLREYFGPNHPYGTPVAGTPETLKRLTPADLKTQHEAIFQPQNTTLLVAGSLDEAAVKASLEKALGKWQGNRTPVAKPAYPAPANQALRVLLVDRPGAVQTVVRFVLPAPPYNDPNREGLSSLSTLLGGGFTSRLNQNIREDKGYAYGAGSRFIFAPQVGYAIATSSVRADVTGPSIKEFLNEFKRLGGGDVTDPEAGKAASTRRSELVETMGSLTGLLGVAAGYELNGRPFSALGEDLKKLGSLTAKDLNTLAPNALPLDRGLLILVGDKATILKQVEGLGLPTPVEVKAGN
ncbi:MAG: M16 family metallopeptidase [Fimbriimonas sp.]